MKEEIKNCPMCPRGCSIEHPSCGRGEAFARELNENPEKAAESFTRRENGHEHSFHRSGRHGFNADPNTIAGLLQRCGHILHHGEVDPEAVGAGLTDDEKEQLRALLHKVLNGLE